MEQYNGLVEDTRTSEQKAMDWQDSELFGKSIVNWVEKPQYKTYTLREQDGSGSCVAQSCAKALETLTSNIESALPIYWNRIGKPNGGMYYGNCGDIAKKIGTNLESIIPSQNMNDWQMDGTTFGDTPIKIDGYVFVTPTDIDAIAQAIDNHSHCMIACKFTHDEWEQNMPVVDYTATGFGGHSVCAVDYAIIDGKKCLIIDESWGNGRTAQGQRYITEEYLKNRCIGAMYLLKTLPTHVVKPKFTFLHDLHFGMMNDPQVKILQQCLAVEGLFPPTSFTGNFLSITKQAVIKFQTKYGLVPDGYCGKLTGAKLAELYS